MCLSTQRGLYLWFGLQFKTNSNLLSTQQLLPTCRRGHVLDPVASFTPDPVVSTAAQSKVTSFEHDVASSTGFSLLLDFSVFIFASFSSCITI